MSICSIGATTGALMPSPARPISAISGESPTTSLGSSTRSEPARHRSASSADPGNRQHPERREHHRRCDTDRGGESRELAYRRTSLVFVREQSAKRLWGCAMTDRIRLATPVALLILCLPTAGWAQAVSPTPAQGISPSTGGAISPPPGNESAPEDW